MTPDSVSVRMASGCNRLLIEQWFSIALQRRVKLIMEGRVEFLRGSQPVPIRDALEALRGIEADWKRRASKRPSSPYMQ